MKSKNTPAEPEKKPRQISRFLAQQMLYDFITGDLDADRKKAVEDFLKKDVETADELRRMQQADHYLKALSQTQMSEPLIDEIKNHKTKWSQAVEQAAWKNWPDFLRWGFEALSVALVVGALAIFIPWDELQSLLPRARQGAVLKTQDDEHVELSNNDEVNEPAESPSMEGENKTPPVKVDVPPPPPPKAIAKAPPTPVPTPAPKKVAAAPISEPAESIDTHEGGSESPPDDHPSATAQAPAVVKPSKPPAPARPATEAQDIADSEKSQQGAQAEAKGKGVLYRMFMTSSNIDEVIPTVVQEVEKLGGVKAGQVALGWKKDDSGYFHFTMPEPNYEPLMNSLRYFGPVRVQIDAHPRVMPKGTIRIILMVEPEAQQ